MPEEQKKKKKHKLRKPKEIARIDGDFHIICADLSLRCPGFARLLYDSKKKQVHLEYKSHVDNSKDTKKSHGEILFEIGKEFSHHYLCNDDGTIEGLPTLYVRERGFSRFSQETICLAKTAGLMDFMLAGCIKSWIELSPATIKKLLTNNSKATKEEVANSLKEYIGEYTYSVSDESDSIAAGLSFLLQENYIDKRSSDE